MRFTYAEAMTDVRYYAPLAQAAEAAGYDSMTVADSLIYPAESDAEYPYTEDGDRDIDDRQRDWSGDRREGERAGDGARHHQPRAAEQRVEAGEEQP